MTDGLPPRLRAILLWLAGFGRKLLIVPPILVGLLVVRGLVATREELPEADAARSARPVRVVPVQRVELVPRAAGYGRVQPGKSWSGVIQVTGRITWMEPRVEVGAILAAGTKILEIDRTDLEIKKATIEAQMATLQAQRAKLDATEATYTANLAIENRSLDVAKSQVARLERLEGRGVGTQEELESAQRNQLLQEAKIQEIRNAIQLLEAERLILDAQLGEAEVSLRQVETDVSRTTLTVPFVCRIAEVHVEQTQFVQAGQTMLVVDGLETAEVTGQFSFEQLGPLIGGRVPVIDPLAPDFDPERVFQRIPVGAARVSVGIGNRSAEWPATFVRSSPVIDERSRTFGMIVEVANPYRAIPGQRPPLVKGSFVEVEISGRSRPALVIPRSALRDDGSIVHVADGKNRLTIREVTVAHTQGPVAVVASGLREGDRIVVSDVSPVYEGLPLTPRVDEGLTREIAADATASGHRRRLRGGR